MKTKILVAMFFLGAFLVLPQEAQAEFIGPRPVVRTPGFAGPQGFAPNHGFRPSTRVNVNVRVNVRNTVNNHYGRYFRAFGNYLNQYMAYQQAYFHWMMAYYQYYARRYYRPRRRFSLAISTPFFGLGINSVRF